MPLTIMKQRAKLLFLVFCVILSLLILRVGYWQIIRGEEMREKVMSQQTGKTNVVALRGTIYDRNGKSLAQSANVNTLICNPQDIKDSNVKGEDGTVQTEAAKVIAEKLSVILDMDYDKIYGLVTKSNRYQVIKKRLNVEETEQIKQLKDKSVDKNIAKIFKGISFEEDSKRYYSYNVAPHVLGFTGYDNNGLQGVEMSFDNELSGRAGGIFTAQAAGGTTLSDLQYEAYEQAQKGSDVVLTIDETIQHYLEKHLEKAVKENELKEGAAGIVMNPKTGEILAIATKPDFDANNPYDVAQFEKYAVGFEYHSEILDRDIKQSDKFEVLGGSTSSSDEPKEVERTEKDSDGNKKTVNVIDISKYSPEEQEEILSEREVAMRNKMWRNKAVSDAYEPGSTFKIITAAAGLEEGVVDLNTPFVCNGSKRIGGFDIHCHVTSGHGAQTFLEGVKHSCNIVFMDTGLKLGPEKFSEYFEAFGFTKKTNIELSGETNSIFYKNKMSETDVATSSFGQGFNITPIQMITAVSAVINGGNLLKPQIVKEIRNDTGVVKSYQTEVINKVISEETSRKMRDILEQVVCAPDGTGKNAYISGYRIGGKTGTSQKGDRSGTKRIASFIGFAPADDPQLVCLIVLDEPQVANKFGGTIAAPVAGSVIEDSLEYLGVERQYTEKDSSKTKKISVLDVRDLDISDAKEDLTKSGLNVKISGKGNKVVDQLPKPGMQLSQNSTVLLYTDSDVSPSPVTVPNLTGLSINECRSVLKQHGLNFETIGAGQNTTSGAYAVKQSINAGESVAPATVIGVEFRHKASD